jgi:transposase
VKRKWQLPAEVRRPKKELEAFLARVLEHLGPEDHAIARAHVEAIRYLLDVLGDKNLSLKRLRRMVFGSKSEKTSELLGEPDAKEEPQGEAPDEPLAAAEKRRKGHGRNGISEYCGAEEIHVPHATLRSGQVCPCCKVGRVYDTGRPGVEPRIKGRPPLEATVYRPERLRCNLCGEVFTAELPEEAGGKKYDETAASTIIILKYGTGVPFYRLESLEESLGVPLPAAIQWEVVEQASRACAPAHEELQRQAAQGEILHNDDTKMKILGRKKKGEEEAGAKGKKRKGVFTTGIISKVEGHTIALYVTGERNAGENLGRLLQMRAKDLPRPLQMADGLEANLPKGFETILASCAAHGRRKFVELHSCFPEECRVVLEIFREIYHNDELSKDMSPEERLRFHKEHSGPLMTKLKEWLDAQFGEKKVEPNSRLGRAISYLLDRWEPLGRFLEVPGAPLDNNIVERALKLAILHRKNALYYRTARGAQVGDLFMSLIQTTRLAGESPFEYLTALQRHAAAVRERPGDWMPWNYRLTLERIEASRAGAKGPTAASMASEKPGL